MFHLWKAREKQDAFFAAAQAKQHITRGDMFLVMPVDLHDFFTVWDKDEKDSLFYVMSFMVYNQFPHAI